MAMTPLPRLELVCDLCRTAGVDALQRCHRCDRELCPTCYTPWEGLVCPYCRHPASGPGATFHRRPVRHLRVVSS